MTRAARMPAEGGKKPNYTILLVVVYLWALIATPQYRFDLLVTLQYEKIIVGLAWLTLIFSGRFQARFTTTSWLLLFFYVWMLFSYAASPYPETGDAQWWIETYWKLMVFYFLVLFAVEDVEDLHGLLAGLVVVSVLYQLHSWIDFVQGGAYVWQQGVRRIIGVWSASGLGAPNAFGLLGLFTLPFAVAWYRLTERPMLRWGLIGAMMVCCASILFSGTRAALAGLVFFVFLRYWRQLLRPLPVILLAIAAAASLAVLPDTLKQRYLSLVVDEQQLDLPAEELASASARSRIEGLKDGIKLGLRRPLLGYGPGSSAVAREEVLPGEAPKSLDEQALQLHSLYGQVMAETGIIGTLLAMWLALHALRNLRRIRREARGMTAEWASALYVAFLVFLFYGFASHTLYRFHWLLLFAAQAALMDVWRRRAEVRSPARAGRMHAPRLARPAR